MKKRIIDFELLAQDYGIILPHAQDYSDSETGRMVMDRVLAGDIAPPLFPAQAEIITTPNAGIPAYLSNFIDPEFTEVLTSPMSAAEIMGEKKKGDWTTDTAQFPMIESAGEVSSYTDYANNGEITANVNFESRQSYHYQTLTQWGEKELDKMGLAKVDWASRLNIASALIMNKFQNKTYFFGVEGLDNYGLLNDPALPASIAPSSGTPWSGKDALGVYGDIQALYQQAQIQANGTIGLDTEFILAMSPISEVNLTKATQYNVTVMDLLKKNFPRLTVKTAVEYSTEAGELVQLIAVEVEGQETVYAAFTEKMRAHAIVRDTSSFLQKKSGGTWGAIIRQPFAIASMIGV